MVTTNDSNLWSKMWSYKDQGKSWESVYEKKHSQGFRWLHNRFGTNWRMTEMQAAIGRIQLARMPEWDEKRWHNANKIWNMAANTVGLRVPFIPNYIKHAAYKCYLFVEHEYLKSSWDRDRIIHEINRRWVPCYTGSCSEVYLEAAFNNTSYRPLQRLPGARELGDTSLMFLVHPTLRDEELDKFCAAIRELMEQAC